MLAERTKQMIQEFYSHHQDGKTIPEIAQIYSISEQTVYNHLQTIAENNGVSRDSLLEVVPKPYEKNMSIRAPKEHVNPNELRQDFVDTLNGINSIIKKIDEACDSSIEQEEE